MSRRVEINRPLLDVALTDGATISWDVSGAPVANVTLGGDRTMAAATGQRPGDTYVLRVIQDGTGGRTLTWNSNYVFHADGPPVLSAAASDEDVLVFVSDGTNMNCVTPQKRGLGPRGYIDGLIMSNDTDNNHDISIAAGEATMIESTTSEARVLGVLDSAIVKQIDANWAEGSAAGGFPSALTLSNTTWYHVFIIAKTDGTVDAGYDTSTSATNLLSDASAYSFYRRIGSVLTDGTANIIEFEQFGDTFWWHSPPLDVNDGSADDNETYVLSVPTGYSNTVFLTADEDDANISYIHNPGLTGSAPAASSSPLVTIETNGIVVGFPIQTNTSSQITVQKDGTSTAFQLVTLGWIDDRGRNA